MPCLGKGNWCTRRSWPEEEKGYKDSLATVSVMVVRGSETPLPFRLQNKSCGVEISTLGLFCSLSLKCHTMLELLMWWLFPVVRGDS